jgi:hypothetical protein
MATIRPAMAIPASAPADSPPVFELDGLLELDGMLVALKEGDCVSVDTEVIDDAVIVDSIDCETIIDVADVAASGFPHWVGIN